MKPHPYELEDRAHSGIAQVVINWARYLPEFGIDVVDPGAEADVSIGHAAADPTADIHVSHGLLWTEEYEFDGDYAFDVNAGLAYAAIHAKEIIVPSEWVADVYRRDLHIRPHVIRHGVNWEEWQGGKDLGYVLWTKNRTSDGLNPAALDELARAFPDIQFVSTFGNPDIANLEILNGPIAFRDMQEWIKGASVVLATDRETWGISAAEAMAAGVPVLSTNSGAVPVFMQHGVSGYCYNHTSLDDAIQGLRYCLDNRHILGKNARAIAKRDLDWHWAVKQVAKVIRLAAKPEPEATVTVVIPCHNYAKSLTRAVESALKQTLVPEVIIVDDSSTDDTAKIGKELARNPHVKYMRVEVQNVALARNAGFYAAAGNFVIPLDADDYLEEHYIERVIEPLLYDRSLDFSYTGVRVITSNGTIYVPPQVEPLPGETTGRDWPTMDFDRQFLKENQIPTCCMIRKSSFKNIGGYRARYCPTGAGSEDAEMYLRLLAFGGRAYMVPPEHGSLWVHMHGEGNVSGTIGYQEPDWTAWHPWCKDYRFPFVAAAHPRRSSHPIRSYEPDVSVIIPVGPGHDGVLVDALDSLEAQFNRGWEGICVWDYNPGKEIIDYYTQAYPHIKFFNTGGGRGPGFARNYGVDHAEADFITFLDADDYYSPEFLTHVNPATCIDYQAIVYSQYYTRMTKKIHGQITGRIFRDEGNTVLVDYSFRHFNRDLAMTRPKGQRPYVWSGVNILLPKIWHYNVGGFDISMDTWEDCDYLLKLAWRGYNFHMIEQPLWVYNFKEGTRRDESFGRESELMRLLQRKYDILFGGDR